MIVLLGEVGGVEEYEVCEAIQNKTITKPLVAWCIGKNICNVINETEKHFVCTTLICSCYFQLYNSNFCFKLW